MREARKFLAVTLRRNRAEKGQACAFESPMIRIRRWRNDLMVLLGQ